MKILKICDIEHWHLFLANNHLVSEDVVFVIIQCVAETNFLQNQWIYHINWKNSSPWQDLQLGCTSSRFHPFYFGLPWNFDNIPHWRTTLIDFITYGCFHHSLQPVNPVSSQLHSYPTKLHIFDPPTNLEEPDFIIFNYLKTRKVNF